MKILENNYYVTITCEDCGSILGVEESDLRVIGDRIYECTCAACGDVFKLDHYDIPSFWLIKDEP